MPRKYETVSFKLCRCSFKWRCNCLIPRRAKPHPSFNSGTKLFSMMGLHPKLQFTATSPAVGSYNPRPIYRVPGGISSFWDTPHLGIVGECKVRQSRDSWKAEEETAHFSATMGGKLPRAYRIQRNLQIGRGPGTHAILRWPESTLEMSCKGWGEDVDFGTVPRFEPSYRSTTPGPGYTLKVHNPYYYLDQNRFKSFSHVPSFEFDGIAPRFRETRRSWSLPCNRYKVKYPDSLEAFLRKVTSRRGPYDLFTGPRDGSTIKGYWAPAKLVDSGDWPRKLPGEIEKLLSRTNYFRGRWSTNPRFTKKPVTRMMLQDISTCYKSPDEPGPAAYDPRTPRKPSSLKRYPFGTNVEYVRPLPSSDVSAPGRYRLVEKRRVKGDGWTCVFKSKVPRTIGAIIPPSYRDF